MDTDTVPSTAHGAVGHADQTDPHVRRSQGDRSQAGWGADLDKTNRPAVPMERTPPRLPNVHWDVPAQQMPKIKVYHSNERPGISPVFGTSVPPSGLSGKMRDLAFRFSENDLRHWMILLAADRVNVGEGLLSDLAHGHLPNLFAEMGGPAEWRYNRAGFVRKAIVASAVVGIAVWWLRRPGERRVARRRHDD